jgi:hypothetical protein
MQDRWEHAVSELAGLQREFQGYVLQRAPGVLGRVRGTGAADAATRMNVYAEGYALRLLEALETDYPGVKAIAGADDFEALGRAFIAEFPSTYRNLRWYGERLAQFLAQSPAWSGRTELADMARFEWAMATSFDALDAACLTRESLAGIAPAHWPHLTLVVHPAVQRVRLQTNAPAAWSAQARGDCVPGPRRDPHSTTWLLTRRQLQVRFRAMAPQEAGAFDRVAARAPFQVWCSELGAIVGEQLAAARAVEYLNQWLADGALAGFVLGPA